MARTTKEKLNDSINVPVPRALKRRVMALCDRLREESGHQVARTAYARNLIREGVEREEKRLGISTELVGAK